MIYGTNSGLRRKFSWGFIHWHMVAIYIWCALFLTSQVDVIFMFPNQSYREICWHNMHILLHALPIFYVSLHWILYKVSALQVTISEENKLNATTQQLIIVNIWGYALKQGSKTHSSLRQSNVQLQSHYEIPECLRHCETLSNAWMFETLWDIIKCLNVWDIMRHFQMPECFYVNNCCFWARASVLSCYINW